MSLPDITSALHPESLATERPAGRTPAWWGMVLLIATEVTLFAVLLASYFYLRFTEGGPWPPGDIKEPELVKPLVMTVLLLGSSGPMAWADRAIRRGRTGHVLAGLGATWVLGASFLGLQATEYATKLETFTWTSGAYGSLFYTITGFHGFHVAVGLSMIAFAWGGVLRGMYGVDRHERIRLVAFYWHAIDGLWLLILTSLYVGPHL